MDPGIYKIIHFVGLIVLFLGIGSLMTSDPKKPASFRLPAMIHGIGLLLILVSGFGLQAKLKLGFPIWMISKLVILLVLGGSIALIKRRALPPIVIYILVIFLGSIAAYLGFSNSMVLRP
ncbi:MAG: hypothetical protein HOK04_09175 [Verrucomicrobia bacterium]|nr:hypothetical protein [Verrucomicrobiota bacterium]